MAMNPLALLKVKKSWETFCGNHPRFPAFLQAVQAAGIKEGYSYECFVCRWIVFGRTYGRELLWRIVCFNHWLKHWRISHTRGRIGRHYVALNPQKARLPLVLWQVYDVRRNDKHPPYDPCPCHPAPFNIVYIINPFDFV